MKNSPENFCTALSLLEKEKTWVGGGSEIKQIDKLVTHNLKIVLEKVTALIIATLTIRQLWLSNVKAKLEIEKLRQEIKVVFKPLKRL